MSERTADLHMHTTFSDGTDTPEQLVARARGAGLSAMSITDHDNTEAFARAEPVAGRLGIELIPGIEMSASYDGLEVHLLGFLLDFQTPELVAYLATQQARRVVRVREMVRRLGAVGVQIDAEEVLALAGEGTVGRPHVARTLLKRGYVTDASEAFSKYIGPGNPGFVPGSPMAPGEVIRIIRAAGGIPVLAHPIYLDRDALIDQFVGEGLLGLEVYHSGHTPEHVKRYERIADRLALLKTGGSDYHGTNKEGVPVGVVRIPLPLVDALKQWKASATRG